MIKRLIVIVLLVLSYKLILYNKTGTEFSKSNDYSGYENYISDEPSHTDFSNIVTELSRDYKSRDEFKYISIYFLAPIGFSDDDVVVHATKFAEDEMKKHSEIIILGLTYFDREVHEKYWDRYLASVSWNPYGELADLRTAPLEDYSYHKFGFDFSEYHSEYELSQSEIELYEALQLYSMEYSGKYVAKFYNSINDFIGDISVYEHVADKYGVTVDCLKQIRLKTCERLSFRMYNTHQIEPPNRVNKNNNVIKKLE